MTEKGGKDLKWTYSSSFPCCKHARSDSLAQELTEIKRKIEVFLEFLDRIGAGLVLQCSKQVQQGIEFNDDVVNNDHRPHMFC